MTVTMTLLSLLCFLACLLSPSHSHTHSHTHSHIHSHSYSHTFKSIPSRLHLRSPSIISRTISSANLQFRPKDISNDFFIKKNDKDSLQLKELTNNDKSELSIGGIMLCGAISRTMAALAIHPLHALKVNLQLEKDPKISVSQSLLSSSILPLLTRSTLTRGLGTQLLLTLPHGALSFAITETTKKWLRNTTSSLELFQNRSGLDPVLDLLSASVASLACSVISIPQMLLTDRIMVGLYPNLRYGIHDILTTQGVRGLYRGWVPGMLLKLPSSALTWMFYQQFRKRVPVDQLGQYRLALASLSAAAACVLMNPVDTIKTRLLMRQRLAAGSSDASLTEYDGILDCFRQVYMSEGWTAFYTSLPPRLLSVVPMIGIQFAFYDMLKSRLQKNKLLLNNKNNLRVDFTPDQFTSAGRQKTDETLSHWRSWLRKGGFIKESASLSGSQLLVGNSGTKDYSKSYTAAVPVSEKVIDEPSEDVEDESADNYSPPALIPPPPPCDTS